MEQYPNSYYVASLNKDKESFPSLNDELSCDLCVIGGGFTGLSTAIEAAKKGLNVILLEQNLIAWGASGRNGGQIWPDVAWGIDIIEKNYGINFAKQIWDISLNAVNLIDQRIEEFNIDCDKKNGGITAATSASKMKEYEKEMKYKFKTYGYDKLDILDKSEVKNEIGSSLYYGGVLDYGAGHLHPLKYAIGLMHVAQSLGVKMYENSSVEKINEDRNNVEVILTSGKVKAKNIAICCNAYLEELNMNFKNRVMPCETYIVCTEHLNSSLQEHVLPNDYCVSDTNFDLNYYRLSASKRMIFGGAVGYSLKNVESLKKRTKRQLDKIFPQLSNLKIDYIWGGLIALTMNRVPDIGMESEKIFYAQGFSGHGVALTGMAGKILAESIVNGKTTELESFEKIKHRKFPGGRLFRMPLLVTISAMQRMADIFNV
tara:strand:+ start:601 stop:1890 length:1290 start_codon:yes stop_codon:yes gene_type:complete